jgi:1,4-alpha-glucan branching enzyme
MTGPHSHPLARNAARKTVKPINFTCLAPEARRVTLIGDFNDWDANAHPLKRHVDGSWSLQITLGHGHHHYQFLVDGKPTLDPRAQGIARNEQNEKVSLLAVS